MRARHTQLVMLCIKLMWNVAEVKLEYPLSVDCDFLLDSSALSFSLSASSGVLGGLLLVYNNSSSFCSITSIAMGSIFSLARI